MQGGGTMQGVPKSPQNPQARIEYDIKQLFERHTIQEIRIREQTTREEIEAKSQDLRKLVGTRYRDLIESADSVIAMKEAASEMCKKLERIEGGCKSLLTLVRSVDSSQTTTNNEDRTLHRRKMYHLARQIKLLVDAPEQIWSSMEECDHFTATLLYTSAEQVHSNLTTEEHSSHLLTSIPLVIRQWGLISQFPGEIKYKSRQQLRTSGASSQHYAGSLCSLMLLDNLSPLDAFRAFLDAQEEAVLHTLDHSPRQAASVIDDITDKVCRLVGVVHCALFHMGAVFSPSFATGCYGTDSPLLWSLLQHAFHPTSGDSAYTGPTASFARSCLGMKKELSDEVVQSACCEWLRKCGAAVRESVGKLLLSNVHHATDLLQMQKAFLTAIAQPPFPPLHHGNSLGHDHQNSVWGKICGLVLHWDVDLWTFLLGDIFLATSKNIIKETFSTLNLNAIEHDLATLEEDESVGKHVWGRVREKENIHLTKLEASAVMPKINNLIGLFDKQLESAMEDLKYLIYDTVAGENSEETEASTGKRKNDGMAFVWHFDEQQEKEPDDEDNNPATTQSSLDRQLLKARRQDNIKQRLELREYLQQTCFNAVSALLDDLKSKMDRLSIKVLAGKSDNKSVSMVLFVSRLCWAISEQSTQLQRIFQEDPLGLDAEGNSKKRKQSHDKGKPYMSSKMQSILQRRMAHKDLAAGEPTSSRFSQVAAKLNANPRLKELLVILRRLYLRGYVHWAHYATLKLGGKLKSSIFEDDWSDSEKNKLWYGTTVAIENASGGGQEDLIPLPYQPSSYILAFTFSVCQEIHRVAAHMPDKLALHYFASRLLAEVIEYYGELISNQERSQKMCKEGVVQISFDTRLLFEILSGGYVVPEDEDLKSALEMEGLSVQPSLRHRADTLALQIESCLDPIDRAFYGPHLTVFVEQCYGRCYSLLGFLRMLHPTPATLSKYRSTKQEQHNALPLVTQCPRFHYLPVSPLASTTHTQPTVTSSTTSASPIDTFAPLPTQQHSQGGPAAAAGRGATLSLFEQVGRRFGSLV